MFTRIMAIGLITAVLTIIQFAYFALGIQYFITDTSNVMEVYN